MRGERLDGAALRLIVYAVDGTDAETLNGLRQQYAQQGVFHEFYYLNEIAGAPAPGLELIYAR